MLFWLDFAVLQRLYRGVVVMLVSFPVYRLLLSNFMLMFHGLVLYSGYRFFFDGRVTVFFRSRDADVVSSVVLSCWGRGVGGRIRGRIIAGAAFC